MLGQLNDLAVASQQLSDMRDSVPGLSPHSSVPWPYTSALSHQQRPTMEPGSHFPVMTSWQYCPVLARPASLLLLQFLQKAKYVGNFEEAKFSLQCLPQALISCLKNGSTFS